MSASNEPTSVAHRYRAAGTADPPAPPPPDPPAPPEPPPIRVRVEGAKGLKARPKVEALSEDEQMIIEGYRIATREGYDPMEGMP